LEDAHGGEDEVDGVASGAAATVVGGDIVGFGDDLGDGVGDGDGESTGRSMTSSPT
jgi:hypothetical protein